MKDLPKAKYTKKDKLAMKAILELNKLWYKYDQIIRLKKENE